MKLFKIACAGPALLVLAGCNAVVLHPDGDVAGQQRDLLVQSTVLMLLIIVPVMVLTAVFAIRYRHSNKDATYSPDWDHSTQLELVIWGAPLLIVICLGALTWMGTHLLDPYRPLARVAAGQPVSAVHEPLQVEVVALDWKWLFIYPQYGVATVNELAAPIDRPISFRITASSVMNSFYVPAMAGQIYAMPGMETKLHALLNRVGSYEGFSANYSGAGFSGMRFTALGLSDRDFAAWLDQNKREGADLKRATYLALEQPSENDPVHRYASVDPELFDAIVNMCVERGKMCMREMMAIDAKGGLGLAGVNAVMPRALAYDKYQRRGAVFGPEPTYVASICTVEAPRGRVAEAAPVPSLVPLTGMGLTPWAERWRATLSALPLERSPVGAS